ncbi:uncharacterized protein LOC122306404 [Carya illinoinensis]|uniref:uncharacterized protein LOC122306404 n=1 Tax=Carya illinoinensis TaxID=32201 RepID=UPI001C728567|nr:uncharacterized protein LOC122306404 [Carya illinoinensis]
MENNSYDTEEYTSDIDNGEEEEKEDDIDFMIALQLMMASKYYTTYMVKEPCRTSPHIGHKFVMEILNGHHDRCHQQFRMEKDVFHTLCKELNGRYNLTSTRNITIEEMVGIFLITLGHGFGNTMAQERFQHSGETISRHFNSVLMVVSRMAVDIISLTDREFKDVSKKIREDERYWPYFNDCIGAIDGTHVPVTISPTKQIPFIGRKGIPTQNIMAVCDFYMRFTFVWVGWEGTAHDTRIFMEAIQKEELQFPHPPRGKYYLVDAAYPHMNGYMGPYRRERYHLPDFRRGPRPMDIEFKPYDDDEDYLPPGSMEDEEAEDYSSMQQSEISNENVINIERNYITVSLMHG